jgi:hypothetical protein
MPLWQINYVVKSSLGGAGEASGSSWRVQAWKGNDISLQDDIWLLLILWMIARICVKILQASHKVRM